MTTTTTSRRLLLAAMALVVVAMAPAWNVAVEKFAGNDDVVFGDVNLSEDAIRDPYSPGAGGWPTIMYFNKQTGIEGGKYEKKTSKSMCDELGDVDTLVEYIEEAGNTSLCDINTTQGCNEKQVGYIEKMSAKSREELEAQAKRLSGMMEGSMKPELKAWIVQRSKILKQLLVPAAGGGSSESSEL